MEGLLYPHWRFLCPILGKYFNDFGDSLIVNIMRTYNQISEAIEQEIARKYAEGHSSIRVGKEFGVHFSTVLKIVRRRGIEPRSTTQTSKRYSFNEDFFESIDTEQKAYWLGFILADGCISRGKDLIIVLKASDSEHLKKFVADIKGTNQFQHIRNNGGFNGINAVRLSIRSKKMCDDLKKHGITERKSLTAKIPSCVPAPLRHHFWRGVVDGDGHVCVNRQGKYKYLEVGLCGNKSVVTSFSTFIANIIGVRPAVCSDHSIWKTKVGCKNASKLCTCLYDKSVIFLERKLNIYKEYVEDNAHRS